MQDTTRMVLGPDVAIVGIGRALGFETETSGDDRPGFLHHLPDHGQQHKRRQQTKCAFLDRPAATLDQITSARTVEGIDWITFDVNQLFRSHFQAPVTFCDEFQLRRLTVEVGQDLPR